LKPGAPKAAHQRKEIVLMHEAFKRRIAQLERERAQQAQPSFVIAFRFIDRDGAPIDAVVAKGPGNFISRRREGEALDAFHTRAEQECLAARPCGMPSVLFFTGPDPAEPDHAA
jgi:hypothetical protein